MRNRIFKKYFIMISAVILLSIFCLGALLLLISYNLSHTVDKDYMLGLYDKFESIEDIYDNTNYTSTEMSTFLRDNECQLLIVSAEGEVIYTSENGTFPFKIINRRIFSDISEKPSYIYTCLDGFYNNEIVHIAAQAKYKSSGVQYIMLVKCDKTSSTQVNTIVIAAVFIFAVVIAFVLFASYIIARNATDAAQQLTDASNRYAKGDFSHIVSIDERSDLNDLADNLNEMAQQLEKAETTRNSFIANVSHELRTPMTSIVGFVDGILDGTIPEEEQKKYLNIVSDETKRLTKLVYSMINMTKLEGDNTKLNKSECSIIEIIVSCLTSFEKRIDEKSIQICGLDRDKIKVYADKDLLHQVIYNLTENAVKFVNESGYIEYDFKTLEDGSFFFSISNSGKGIGKDELSLVFNKFYKTDKSRGLDKSGMGIGLYLCKSIIELHDGKIKVSSSKGVVTEFSFTIPQNNAEEQ